MNTVKKIGNAALQRVFKKESTTKGTVEFSREVCCVNNFELWQQIRYDGYEETNDSVSRYKMKVYLWGIELGLVEISTEETLTEAKGHFLAYGGTLAKCLAKDFNAKPHPSHCVIVECFSQYWTLDKHGQDSEVVSIYSISEAQKKELKSLCSQRTAQEEFTEVKK